MEKKPLTLTGRREFLTSVGVLAGASVLTGLPGTGFAARSAALTVKQVIDIALSETEGAPLPRSVDQLRAGSLDQQVTGIVTTTFPTIDVINKAIKAGANMIISHEAVFYNNDDNLARLTNDDIYKYKFNLLEKNKIAIWRFHDSWHAHKPDGITWGTLLALGWEKYYDPAKPRIITLPKTITLQEAVTLSKAKLSAPQVRVIGDLKKPVKTVYFTLGSIPSAEVIKVIQAEKPDLVISGESREWEVCERVQDGMYMGLNTKLIVLGHAVSEEAGMAYAASWLGPKVAGVKVTHIAAGTPFKYV
ncbi:Nif3-like dinuclear metal center hexameric protein [Mucilaginibacter auburnensis]|uniref:Putative NIF3 family GTP cyclohydrolase 1 type 2 n=1 Tax=Mucilaginibacter auburnensis TaxID=1457233 RepID=A0A2H9VLD1_9SPHI|nr:Nif3-like dinuclear metal center hexameric protein [Mucilaginibacter auburnensis]PJJ79122.1 putative NIF3 family GTP cyclohydrolase 1 type 2 [Mucilaginibacter auburnensis]